MANVIDYSKFDKIELSDDSDIEVHPNVDKKSFIRWKQRDIHEKRLAKKGAIERQESEIRLEEKMLQTLQFIEQNLDGGWDNIDVFVRQGMAIAANDDHHNAGEKQLFDDIVEKRVRKVIGDVRGGGGSPKELLHSFIKEQRERLAVSREEFAAAKAEASKKITADDLHIGFDSSQIRKNKAIGSSGSKAPPQISGRGARSTETTTQDLSSGVEADIDDENLDAEHIEPSAIGRKFGEIPIGRYDLCYQFISSNPDVLQEKETDGLLIQAYHTQMHGNEDASQRYVHQALLIQYCRQLGRDGVSLFFQRITTGNHRALRIFEDDVKQTYNRIKTRAAEMAREEAAPSGGVEQIQLHAVDPNTSISITIPPVNGRDEESKKARRIFESFPPNFQKALESRHLEEINAVLGKMSVDEAEEVVGQLGKARILSLEETIYDGTSGEWQEQPASNLDGSNE